MNILIIGAGGREHALAWKVAQSPLAGQVLVAPGNAGTAQEPGIENVPVNMLDFNALAALVQARDIGLTIVGPEVPLVRGIVDHFHALGLRCFGPTRMAAQLEGSKSFTKDFLARHNIPTAGYATFTEIPPAVEYLRAHAVPMVVKADGLAAGKGVVLAQTTEEAIAAVRNMLAGNAFGDAGQRVVIEEFLAGEEASFIAMVDGEHCLPLATSQDHKARDNGDAGPNTGGMGACSPAPVVTPAIHERIMQDVMLPTVRGMAAEGHPFTGFLYAGVMIGPDGTPNVLEFNVRCGDPETQPVMCRMRSDLVALCNAALDGRLHRVEAEWDARAALGVVMAAGGYPGSYRTGDVIQGLPLPDDMPCKVFHAATRAQNGTLLTDGGRALCVCALGDTIAAAQRQAYACVDRIHWPDVHYRTDIGYRAVQREAET
jgi:phosphoribosylamine--glycine ligase